MYLNNKYVILFQYLRYVSILVSCILDTPHHWITCFYRRVVTGLVEINFRNYRHNFCWHYSSHRFDSQIFVKRAIFVSPPAYAAPVRGSSSDVGSLYCSNVVWYGKTRMVWLRDGEKNLKIRLLVSLEYTNVSDNRQTEGHHVMA